jgi:U3 small nucleolar RNA-associated protein 11
VTTDLGWRTPSEKKGKRRQPPSLEQNTDHTSVALKEEAAQHRKRLLQELSARLTRDIQLRYAIRELEMQRLLMGKGARKKLRGVEKIEGADGHDDEDEDELDARKGRPRKESRKPVDETLRKPRVYKWKLERKK